MTTTATSALHNQSNSWTNYAYSDLAVTGGDITITGQMASLTAGTYSVIGLNDGATTSGFSCLCSFRVDSDYTVDVKKYVDTNIVTGISVSPGDIFKVKYSWDTGYATFYINDIEVPASTTAFSPASLNGYVAGYASDMTRMICFGRVDQRQRELFEAVGEAQLAAIDSVKAGVRAGTVGAIFAKTRAQSGSTARWPPVPPKPPPCPGAEDSPVLLRGLLRRWRCSVRHRHPEQRDVHPDFRRAGGPDSGRRSGANHRPGHHHRCPQFHHQSPASDRPGGYVAQQGAGTESREVRPGPEHRRRSANEGVQEHHRYPGRQRQFHRAGWWRRHSRPSEVPGSPPLPGPNQGRPPGQRPQRIRLHRRLPYRRAPGRPGNHGHPIHSR